MGLERVPREQPRQGSMDVDRAVRFAVVAALVLLVQAAVPPALAHAGDQGQGETGDEDDANASEERGTGFPITPEREFAEQLNPDMDGPRIVWQERLPGENETWDIMLANISEENITAVPLTNTDHDEKAPIIEGDHVAWTIHPSEDPRNENLAVLDLDSGRIRNVPDEGNIESSPTFGADGTLYYAVHQDDKRILKAFDPDTGETTEPLGGREIVGEPAAHGPWLAWGEGSQRSAKFHIKDTRNGNVTEVEGLYHVTDGPELGPAGLAWIAKYGGEFTRGTYTTLYNLTTGLDKFRTSVYPHRGLDHCEAGVVWDQPGTSTTEASAVALWDRFVDGTIMFGAETFSGTCGDDHLVYEQNIRGEADSQQGTRQLYASDLREVRLFRDAQITMEPEDRRSIVESVETFEGTVASQDPREPIVRVMGSVDGSPMEELQTQRTDEGLAWEAVIEPEILDPGRHQLTIRAEDALGRVTEEQYTFYTETPYDLASSTAGGEPNVPRQEDSPFPFNVLNHYQDYRPFYNTAILLLVIVAGLAWYGYRRYAEEPTGTPEYVPPEDP